ncbi:unnamed protein product [Lactuca virosa]|uniref:MATH domain-containing protein n=1 Tax=Lactuca virosa TaxID=75947 RepID=A0AAU9MXC7_9ASTR|nr:unnamed protein product [Lactuca virosa]
MTDSAYRVVTTSRLAQWRIDDFSSSYRKSDPFKIGNWNWHLVVEKNRKIWLIKLFPEIPKLAGDSPPPHPVASFDIRIISFLGGRKTLVHPEVRDKPLHSGEDFIWALEVPLTGKFIIDVEFLDLKTASPDGGEEVFSIWVASEGFPHPQKQNTRAVSSVSLGRMLSESIHTDIIIRASDGSIGPTGRFLQPVHRLHLLRAADKYDVSDLKDACQESLLQDIHANNVLDRLQSASLYRLPMLKLGCLEYLVKFVNTG